MTAAPSPSPGPTAPHARQPGAARRHGGDITTTHDADITPQTINTPGDRLDLHLAIWAAFANARIIQERQQQAADH